MDWAYPAKKDLAWDNPLKAIDFYGSGNDSCQFNFEFKNGQKSNLVTLGALASQFKIKPPDSVVRKLIVHYD
jgi:hypothetical protein